MQLSKVDNHREYGLDILKVLSMLMVIGIHLVGHGGLGRAYAPGSAGDWVVSLGEIAVFPAVNCFVLVSGYLLSALPFKAFRIVRVWLPAAFWSIVIQCVFFLTDQDSISLGKAVYTFLPVLSGRYWFLNAYIVMLLVSPVLNRLLRDLPRWQMFGFLISLLAIFCVSPIFALGNDVFATQNGYAFPWFLVVYLWGGYIRFHCPKSIKLWQPLLGYAIFVLAALLWQQFAKAVAPITMLSRLFMTYTSVPVFGAALCLLQLFRSLQFPAQVSGIRFVSALSSLTFGVYLIHYHPLIRATLLQDGFLFAGQLPWFHTLFLSMGMIITIFSLCALLEWLRKTLFQLLRIEDTATRLCDKLTEKAVSFLKGKL